MDMPHSHIPTGYPVQSFWHSLVHISYHIVVLKRQNRLKAGRCSQYQMIMPWKDFLNIHVLRWRQKVYSDWEDVTSSGKAFQVFGPATGKARLPTVERLTGGTRRRRRIEWPLIKPQCAYEKRLGLSTKCILLYMLGNDALHYFTGYACQWYGSILSRTPVLPFLWATWGNKLP